MRKIIDIIRRRIYVKLSGVFLLTLIVPLSITTVLFVSAYNNLSNANVHELFEDNYRSLIGTLPSDLESVKTAINLLSINEDLVEGINKYQKGYISKEECEGAVNSAITSITPVVSKLSPTIAIFDLQGNPLGGKYYSYCYENETVIQYLIEKAGKDTSHNPLRWAIEDEILMEELPATGSIYAYRKLVNSRTNEPLCIAVMRIKKSDLLRLYYAKTLESQNIYIVSEEGTVISAFENVEIYKDIQHDYLNSMLGIYESVIEADINGRDIIIYNNIDPVTGWHVISAYNRTNYLDRYSAANQRFLGMVVIFALLAFFLALKLTKPFITPIVELRNQMERVQRGDLTASVSVKSIDEVGDLSIAFNRAIEQINILMKHLLLEQEQKRKADISALQAQINPHFIGNTLTSVRYLVYSEDKSAADKVLVDLHKVLRYAISDPDKFVTVNLEMEMLKNYINILEIGLGPDFSYTIDISEGIGDCLTMKLLLQPIVENAILHGLKPVKHKPMLKIEGYERDGVIHFSIIDNGIGFNPDEIDAKKEVCGSRGIGIKNVDQRLKLYFGEKYGVTMQSEVGKGSTVNVVIPRITDEEEYRQYESAFGR